MNVFVSGVSSGIGLSLARAYLAKDATVVGISRREAPIRHSNFLSNQFDLGQTDRIAGVVQALAEPTSGFDLAVLNAGVLGEIRDMAESSLEDMKATMEINLWANKSLIDALAALPNPPSQIVAISSGAAVNGHRGWNGYAISKAALNMMISLYAKELPNIHLTALAPGLVNTAMQDYLGGVDPQNGKFASLQVIQEKRNTPEMPTPEALAPRLIEAIEKLPGLVDSGAFVDIRKPPLGNS